MEFALLDHQQRIFSEFDPAERAAPLPDNGLSSPGRHEQPLFGLGMFVAGLAIARRAGSQGHLRPLNTSCGEKDFELSAYWAGVKASHGTAARCLWGLREVGVFGLRELAWWHWFKGSRLPLRTTSHDHFTLAFTTCLNTSSCAMDGSAILRIRNASTA
jgi:hypothetical protein